MESSREVNALLGCLRLVETAQTFHIHAEAATETRILDGLDCAGYVSDEMTWLIMVDNEC